MKLADLFMDFFNRELKGIHIRGSEVSISGELSAVSQTWMPVLARSDIYEFRQYQPGDPASAVNWNVSARADKLVVGVNYPRKVSPITVFIDPCIYSRKLFYNLHSANELLCYIILMSLKNSYEVRIVDLEHNTVLSIKSFNSFFSNLKHIFRIIETARFASLEKILSGLSQGKDSKTIFLLSVFFVSSIEPVIRIAQQRKRFSFVPCFPARLEPLHAKLLLKRPGEETELNLNGASFEWNNFRNRTESYYRDLAMKFGTAGVFPLILDDEGDVYDSLMRYQNARNN